MENKIVSHLPKILCEYFVSFAIETTPSCGCCEVRACVLCIVRACFLMEGYLKEILYTYSKREQVWQVSQPLRFPVYIYFEHYCSHCVGCRIDNMPCK